MTRIIFVLSYMVLCSLSWSQNVTGKLSAAFRNFENDAQLRSGIASLYVVDAKTGKVVYDKNGMTGLAPASTQKIITAAAAYELLGKEFRYKTGFGYTGAIENGEVAGTIVMQPSGDPTLGSWRWESTKEENLMQRVTAAIKKAGIKKYAGMLVDETGWNYETIPDGWIWQDIGNYYGAGAEVLNWRENQYDVLLRSGKNKGSPVEVITTKPALYRYTVHSTATAAAKGSGDNAYIYFSTGVAQASSVIYVRGTIPVEENRFVISGALPSAKFQFSATLTDSLKNLGINNSFSEPAAQIKTNEPVTVMHTETSPPLDSIIYWFHKKSINLYGEALVKTIAYQKKGLGSTDEGIELIKDFWKTKGIAELELNIVDGSGLSPLNRVTTHAQVAVLQHAKKQPWFSGFYNSLPEYNDMKIKSGTIGGVKGFCGYHTSKSGNDYIFSFLVNNYNGSPSLLVQKMYRVLDVLK